jgi:hypothetical protein
LPAILNFKSVRLDSNQEIEANSVQMYLRVGDRVDVKIDKLNPSSCIVSTKLHLSKDNPKQYLSANHVLLRYGLIEPKTFKVSLDEDFSYRGLSVDLLNKTSNVNHARETSYRYFRNWNIFECKQEFDIDHSITVGIV